jgi:N-acetylmuramoyl-L-alanine amidase
MEKIVVLDPGHGGRTTGAVANGLVEKDLNLTVALKARDYLKAYKVRVELTRETDVYLSATERVSKVRSFSPNLCWSVHHNAYDGTVRGAEIIDAYYNKEDDKLSLDWLARMKAIGMPTRRRFAQLNREGKDYYFMIRDIISSTTEAVISEGGFIDNELDAALLKQPGFLDKEAQTISESIAKYLGLEKANQGPDETKLTPIMGEAKATAEQMASLVLRRNSEPKLPNSTVLELAKIFLEEGAKEGVRGDIAWAQSILETGYFRYGGIVLPEQNNYGGIGATNDTGQGGAASFESPRIGARAQMQHLKAYASTAPLNQENVDPRFDKVKRGSAPYVEWLGYEDNPNGVGWAYPGKGYGANIIRIYNDILKEPAAQTPTEQDTLEEIVDMLNQLSEDTKDCPKSVQQMINEIIEKVKNL